MRRGLSLLELLVVVIILCLLIAIMMPSRAIVHKSARTAICAANLKAIGRGTALYAAQFADELPPQRGPDAKWLCDLREADGLRSIVGSAMAGGMRQDSMTKLFYCPANSTQDPVKLWSRPGGCMIGYAWMGPRESLPEIGIERALPKPRVQFHEKFEKTHAEEAELAFDWIISVDKSTTDYTSVKRGSDTFSTSHLNGAKPSEENVVCFDGHVESRKWAGETKAVAVQCDGAAFWVVNP